MAIPRTVFKVAVAFTAFVFLACHESRYVGDGQLTDDFFSPSQRFALILGRIDLTRPEVVTFRLARLPEKQFTLGFDVSGPRPTGDPLYDSRPISAVVRFTVTDERGRQIIDETAPMNEWVWSGSPHENRSFVYRQGLSRDVPLGDGFVRPEAVGEKADAGWGTYFTPRANGRYMLRIQILKSDSAAGDYDVTVKGVTGGWE
jgi:hypothetical protein